MEQALLTKGSKADAAPAAHRSLLAGWGAVAVLLLLQVGLLWGGIARSLHGFTDFRAYYATGKLVELHHGADIYNLKVQAKAQHYWIGGKGQTLPFLYPAFASLFFVPFAWLSFGHAFFAFAAINLTIIAFVRRWVSSELSVQGPGSRWIAYALTFGLVPTVMAILQGQISFLLLCVFVGALELLRRKHESTAGIVLSLSMVKFQLAIPIALLLCAWKRWTVLRGMLGGTICLGLLSAAVAGPGSTIQYLRMICSLSKATAIDPVGAKAMYGMFPSDMPNIHGFIYVLTTRKSVAALLIVLASGLLMIWAARRDRGIPTALCVAMLVSYHFQAYDLVLLIMPLSVALGATLRQRKEVIQTRIAELRCRCRQRFGLLCIGCGLLVAPVGAAVVYCHMSWLFCASTTAILLSLSSFSSAQLKQV